MQALYYFLTTHLRARLQTADQIRSMAS